MVSPLSTTTTTTFLIFILFIFLIVLLSPVTAQPDADINTSAVDMTISASIIAELKKAGSEVLEFIPVYNYL
ncbi:hypothetical protein F2Q70_00007711 [Brassica cretica]|uniref:Transmembrane protein n=1 Tax=Brassica cretica TaxID=69181 RepID=A0A8S9J8B6_BRACR|nr:hypothetical protein F2Q68_00000726 [Brassica cretica]KAF2611746.1 hypothetical protein F2Q70_00007711 [Brassica cretica]